MLSAAKHKIGIRSLTRRSRFPIRRPISALPPTLLNATLYLNIFQGEPAISGFDWHITPNHSSSEHLAAYNGADLLRALALNHPGHG